MKRIMNQKTFLKSIFFLAIFEVDAAFSGKYVQCHENGTVSITQPLYPKYTGAQNFKLYPRRISEITMKGPPGYEMPHYLVDPKDLVGPFETVEIESVIASSLPFEIVGQDEISTNPYSSCGRLVMRFQNNDTFSGSAAAIDRNLVVTAAHNLLPVNFNNHTNVDKILAQEVRFEHMLIKTDPVVKYPYAAEVSSHCFIHPKWIENFDPRYDIAFIFLSESLNLTQAQVDELLKLRIINEKDTEIRVVGYPKGQKNMQESKGPVVAMKNRDNAPAINSKEIIYHLANTEPGSSGSPIISTSKELTLGESDNNENNIIGIHAYGSSQDIPANSGVKVREELMKFLDESIDLHQNALANSTNLGKFRVQKEKEEKEKLERKLIEQGIEKGIEKGLQQGIEKANQEKKDIIIRMINNKISLEDIAKIANMTLDEVQAIKNELDNSKKRAREEA